MYQEWATAEFSQLSVDDVDSGTELIEFDLEQARFDARIGSIALVTILSNLCRLVKLIVVKEEVVYLVPINLLSHA